MNDKQQSCIPEMATLQSGLAKDEVELYVAHFRKVLDPHGVGVKQAFTWARQALERAVQAFKSDAETIIWRNADFEKVA